MTADLPFDARPVHGATIDDLDLRLLEDDYLPNVVPREMLAVDYRTVEQQLAALRLATVDGTPTNAGLLVLGRDTSMFHPGAYVQSLRIQGTDLAAPVIDERKLTTSLPGLLRELDSLIEVNLRTAMESGDPQRSDYPLLALRQLARNAIMHRNYEGTNAPVRILWYEDRVEIFSPGGPYGAVTIENFASPGVTAYRNPTITRAMVDLGYAQRFGAGIPAARQAIEFNGNLPLELVVDPSFVCVVLRRAR